MLKKILYLSIITILLSASAAFASNTISIIGQGATKDHAIQDGLRKAVESATGVFVYSSSEVKNFTLVKDQIITAARGYVKTFDIKDEFKNDGLVIVKLNVAVDTDKIKTMIRRDVKAITYEDALKDYAAIANQLERNRKYAEILKSISSKPLNELYSIDLTSYKILYAGVNTADIVLSFRIAKNDYLWSVYYAALNQVGSDKGYYNGPFDGDSNMILNYKISADHNTYYELVGTRIFLHKDLNNYIIHPKKAEILYKLSLPKNNEGFIERFSKLMGTSKEVTYSIGPFYIYDNYISNQDDYKYILQDETACKNNKDKCSGYFIDNNGFEYKIRHESMNVEEIKNLPFIKATLKEI